MILNAAREGLANVVSFLLESAAELGVSAIDDRGLNALHLAAEHGHGDVVRVLLNAAPRIDVDVCMALHHAARGGHAEVVGMLLAVPGIDINATTDRGSFTALHFAAHEGHTEVVGMLLAMPGADVNAAGSNGYTAIQFAALEGHTEVVCMLLAVPGVDPMRPTVMGSQHVSLRTAVATLRW